MPHSGQPRLPISDVFPQFYPLGLGHYTAGRSFAGGYGGRCGVVVSQKTGQGGEHGGVTLRLFLITEARLM
jgi:hypothetical protein